MRRLPPRPLALRGRSITTSSALKRQPARAFHPQINPDGEDLQDRADTTRIWLRATQAMVSEYIKDTADRSWAVQVDRRTVDRYFDELIVRLIHPIEIAADTVRQEGTYRAA